MVNTYPVTQENLTRLQQNIIDSLKDEINNVKDTVIKCLLEENQNLRQKM